MRAPRKVGFCLVALLGCPGKDAPKERTPGEAPTTVGKGDSSLEPRVGSPVAAGSLRASGVLAPYGIIVPKGGDADAIRARIETALKARNYSLDTANAKKGERLAGIEIGSLADANAHLVALEFLGRGLSKADVEGLSAATQAVIFATIGPADAIASIQHDGAAIAREVATEGWIVDSGTGEVFSRAEFAQARPDGFPIEVRRLVGVHVVGDAGESVVFIETMGLERLGLPELIVRDVPRASGEKMFELVNAAAQFLVEHGSMTADGELALDLASLRTPPWDIYASAIREHGGSGQVKLRATWAKGEGDSVRIELALPSGNDAEKMRAAASAFLGDMHERAVLAPDKDPELLAASARAKKELAVIAKQCAKKGIAPGENLGVKAPFETSEGTEFMWVEVQSCKGDGFSGVLMNEPNGKSTLAPGAKVEVKLEDAFDYIHLRADGTQQGDETSKIVLKRRGLR